MPTAVNLFSGAGGCSWGFSKAGYTILLAIDHNQAAVTTYHANFPNTPCWKKDVRALTAQEILQQIQLQPGELDILIGGPPCQGFSSAGARFWDDPRNELLAHYLRLLQGIRPRWFLMENVEGLLTTAGGKYMYELVNGFMAAGYNLHIHKLYSHWYGLPQERKRIFLLGTTEYEDFDFPSSTHIEHQSLFDQHSYLSIMDAISDLPSPSNEINIEQAYPGTAHNLYQQSLRSDSVRDHWSITLSPEMYTRIQALKPGQTMKDLPTHLQHASFQRRAKRRVMDGTPTEKRGGAPSGLKRLQAHKPSLTITSAAIREFVHPIEDRFLTLRECARIQSFPDTFRFQGTTGAIIQMIGNAIPPLIAELLAHHIIEIEQSTSRKRVLTQGRLKGFFLTKATSMSPALARTASLLQTLQDESDKYDFIQSTANAT